MGWFEVKDATEKLKKTAEIFIDLQLKDDTRGIQYQISFHDYPPRITIDFYVYPDNPNRRLEKDEPERASSIKKRELDIIRGIMRELEKLKSVYQCKSEFIKTGLLSYTIGVDYSRYKEKK